MDAFIPNLVWALFAFTVTMLAYALVANQTPALMLITSQPEAVREVSNAHLSALKF